MQAQGGGHICLSGSPVHFHAIAIPITLLGDPIHNTGVGISS